jgi:hypothetical protein
MNFARPFRRPVATSHPITGNCYMRRQRAPTT